MSLLTPSSDSRPVVKEDDLVVDVRDVSKKFCRSLKRSLWYGARDMLGELFLARRNSDRLRRREFWAVDRVSLQLRQGEALGIVGRNGAGKTTLLRIISGLIRPDTGEIRTRGRIAPLLSLGAGFRPILTGRENIFVNMSVLGVSTADIKRRFDEVVAFAELESALDAPVATYSSGMVARLGFACAVHVEPDVFIIDEALAVGDVTFRGKCYRKLAELRRRGVSLLLVSHSTHMVMAVCDTAMYLKNGKRMATGPTAEIIARYLDDCGEALSVPRPASYGSHEKPPRLAHQTSGLDILSVQIRAEASSPGAPLTSGQPAMIVLRCRCHRVITDASVFVGVKRARADNEFVLSLNSRMDGQTINLSPGDYELNLRLPTCNLPHGDYSMKVYLEEPPLYMLDAVDWEYLSFQVMAPASMLNCQLYQPRDWQRFQPLSAGSPKPTREAA
jgi:lipopolysaccharide transport system ATP-binding protein